MKSINEFTLRKLDNSSQAKASVASPRPVFSRSTTAMWSAIIPSVFGILGIVYVQKQTVNLEALKATQAHRERLSEAQASALAAFALELETALHRAEYVIWLADVMPSRITLEEMESYLRESKAQLPRLAAAALMCALRNRNAYAEVSPVLASFEALDERISLVAAQSAKSQGAAIRLLAQEATKVRLLRSQLLSALRRASQEVPTLQQ